MATDPFSILRQAAQEYANEKSARDPYAIGSQAFAGLPNGNFDNPWTNMAISLTKGLGSGYLGGVAQNNANQYLNQGISGMLDAYKGGSVSDPLMLPYAKQLQANKMFMDEARAADLADWKAQQQFGFDQTLGLELARNGVAMPSAAKSPLEPAEMSMDSAPMSIDPSSAGNALSEAVKELAVKKPENPLDIYAAQVRSDKDAKAQQSALSAQHKMMMDMERLDIDKTKALSQIAKDGKIEFKEQFEGENKLRDEFKADPINKAYETSTIGFKSLAKAYQDKSPAADLELARGGIQAIEPGYAVREGETAAVEKSDSIPGTLKAAMLKALRGESGLGPTARAGIMRIAARRYSEYANAFETNRQKYISLAQNYKFKPENIVLGDAPLPVEKIWPEYSAPGSEPMPQAQQSQQMTPQKMGLNEFLSWKRQQGL